MDLRRGALQITHYSIGGAEQGIDLCGEQLIDTLLLHYLTHPTIEQDIARQCDDKRANSQYYRKSAHSYGALPSVAL